MHRRPLLDLLAAHRARVPEDDERAGQIARFVHAHTDCFERTCRPGHITASAWVVSADHRRVLLTHHRKLDRWLQVGGHADGDADVLAVAIRETQEESGLRDLTVVGDGPLDLDVHAIPARGDEPEHLHHDVRWLLIAAPDQALELSDESHALRWFEHGELDAILDEESLRRMARRARALLAAR